MFIGMSFFVFIGMSFIDYVYRDEFLWIYFVRVGLGFGLLCFWVDYCVFFLGLLGLCYSFKYYLSCIYCCLGKLIDRLIYIYIYSYKYL